MNWYSALLHATLGVRVPFPAFLSDPLGPWSGVVDFWAGLTDECWKVFTRPANFGKDHEGIPELRVGSFVACKVRVTEMPRGHLPGSRVMDFGNLAIDGRGRAAEGRHALAIYLERFAFFFRRDFLVHSMFEALVRSEMKPERAGFRAASETLFQLYKADGLSGNAGEN